MLKIVMLIISLIDGDNFINVYSSLKKECVILMYILLEDKAE